MLIVSTKELDVHSYSLSVPAVSLGLASKSSWWLPRQLCFLLALLLSGKCQKYKRKEQCSDKKYQTSFGHIKRHMGHHFIINSRFNSFSYFKMK